ncbi:MAG: hypothetical protein JG718_05715 [Candidatus Thiothrix moscowensis]|nr:hypothetical protein [Candidatus Thiothrix moscowensis]
MEAEAATAAVGSNGTLASIGNSLANAGTAAKAFALAHPMGMAVAGGALLGLGTYYAFGKMFGKKKVAEPVMATA